MTNASQPRSDASATPLGGRRPCWMRARRAARRGARRGAIALMVLLTAAVAFRLSALEGTLQPIRVSGPSMGPTLWGPHRWVRCPGCGVAWAIHQPADGRSLPRELVCWNCGSAATLSQTATVTAGDAVLVDRAAYWLRPPRRGDLVAIAADGEPLRVKRVVAVAGDRLALEGARLRVNGDPIAAAIGADAVAWLPVHDDAFRHSAGSWWRHASNGRWTTLPDGFHCAPSTASGRDADWLVYHHRAVHDDLRPDRVRDDDPANVGVSRQLMPVNDLRLSGRLTAEQPATLEIAIWHPDGIRRITHRLPAGTHRWLAATTPSPLADAARPEAGQATSNPSAIPRAAVSAHAPIAIRVQGATVWLDQLRIERPVHWWVGSADAAHWTNPITLAADRYFAVGDNQPLSIDSRSDPHGVTRGQIIGRVIPWRRTAARAPSD